MNKKQQAIHLLDAILKEAEKQDLEYKKTAIRNHQAAQSIGESWMVFHLKALKELLENNG